MKMLKSMKNVKINVKYSGEQLLSSVTTAQSLQYYAFSDRLLHDKQVKFIIDKDYV